MNYNYVYNKHFFMLYPPSCMDSFTLPIFSAKDKCNSALKYPLVTFCNSFLIGIVPMMPKMLSTVFRF